MKVDPFTRTPGVAGNAFINMHYADKIIGSFEDERSSKFVYKIVGLRGSGKTVLLTNISEYFQERKDWIVINITPDTDILLAIVTKLYSRNELQKMFLNAKIDLSAFGIGISIENSSQIFDIGTALEQMLLQLDKRKKR